MSIVIGQITNQQTTELVKDLYNRYARSLLAYTKRCYQINEEDRVDLVYKTLYKVASASASLQFDHESKRRGFVFKTHINFLRNYFRDNKSFEYKNKEVSLENLNQQDHGDEQHINNPMLNLLEKLLAELEDWQRILLLMRGQNVPYNEIAVFVNKPEKHLKVYYARLKKQLLEQMNSQLEITTDDTK